MGHNDENTEPMYNRQMHFREKFGNMKREITIEEENEEMVL